MLCTKSNTNQVQLSNMTMFFKGCLCKFIYLLIYFLYCTLAITYIQKN